MMAQLDELFRKEFEKAHQCYIRKQRNPFCILCRRKNTGIIVASPFFPRSVRSLTGTPLEHTISGYIGYCKSCEDMLSEKEQGLYSLVHAPLAEDFNCAVHVEGEDAARVCYCALSVWWRFASLTCLAYDKSNRGKEFRKLLDVVRWWLHKPRGYLPCGLQFFIYALHPGDAAKLREHGPELAATKFYGHLNNEAGRVSLICMGPVRCMYLYFPWSCFQTSSPIDIPAGKERLELEMYMEIMASECRIGSSRQLLPAVINNDKDEELRLEFEKAQVCYREKTPNRFCILCRKRNCDKRVQLSHITPHSVIKSAGCDIVSTDSTGQQIGHSMSGYRGYCKQCERMLSDNGETNFNRLIHKPLVEDPDCAVRITGKDVRDVYHCALSIWWRHSSLHGLASEKSDDGKKVRQILENIRTWLHDPSDDYLPVGLQVDFNTLHKDDRSFLKEQGIDTDLDYDPFVHDGSPIVQIHLGPLICKYVCTTDGSSLPISLYLDIPEGDKRRRIPQDVLIGYWQRLTEIRMSTLLRCSKEKLPSSSSTLYVHKLDLIPQGIAHILDDCVTFRFHRCIRDLTWSNATMDVSIKLKIYKLKDKPGDGPPYNALMIFSGHYDHKRIRLWLQSETGTTFSIDEKVHVHLLSEDHKRDLEDLVARLRC